MKRRFTVIVLAAIIALTGLFPGTVLAASVAENLIYAAAAYAYINGQLQNINDNHQVQQLQIDKRKTGEVQDPAINERVARIYSQLKANGQIKGNYAIYVSPDNSLNAFLDIGRVICLSRGNVDQLSDDSLAWVMAHELRHGESKHPIAGVQKLLGLSVVVNMYLQRNDNWTSQILAGVTTNYINNEVFTMNQEWEADEHGFNYSVAAGFNPGGGAAYMARVRKQHGEIWVEGLSRIINPNNHPKTSDRVADQSKRMTAYSGGKVSVIEAKTGNIIMVNGQIFMSPKANFGQLQDERSYLIAGKLAKLFHDNPGKLAAASVDDDGDVTFLGASIVTPGDGEDSAEVLVERLNGILGLR